MNYETSELVKFVSVCILIALVVITFGGTIVLYNKNENELTQKMAIIGYEQVYQMTQNGNRLVWTKK